MPPDGESQRGFFRGFAQSPVTYTIACVLVIAGVTLALWGVRTPLGSIWLGWPQWCGLILIGVALFCLYRMGLWPSRPQGTELELCRRRRTGLLVSAISFFTYAIILFSLLALKFRRQASLDPVVYLGGVAAIFLVAGGIKLWRYRREGRKLRRLQGRCEKCGYDLRGLPEPRCPECGTPFTLGNTAR
jgi:hypothetical protein